MGAMIFKCCGCSCHVCSDGHARGQHTIECQDRFFKEFSQAQQISKEKYDGRPVRRTGRAVVAVLLPNS